MHPDGSPLRLGFVWGTPVELERPVGCSEDDYIDLLHAKYIEAVQSLFARHKQRFGYGKEESLSIVSAKYAL